MTTVQRPDITIPTSPKRGQWNVAKTPAHAAKILQATKVGTATTGSPNLFFTNITGRQFLDALNLALNLPNGTTSINVNADNTEEARNILGAISSLNPGGSAISVNIRGNGLEDIVADQIEVPNNITSVGLSGSVIETDSMSTPQPTDGSSGPNPAQSAVQDAVQTVNIVAGRAEVTAENIEDYVTRVSNGDINVGDIRELDLASLNPQTVVDLLNNGLVNPDLETLNILLPYADEMQAIDSHWADLAEAQDGSAPTVTINVSNNAASLDSNILNDNSVQERLADLAANHDAFYQVRPGARTMIDANYTAGTVDQSADTEYPHQVIDVADFIANARTTDDVDDKELVKAKKFNKFKRQVLEHHTKGDIDTVGAILDRIEAAEENVTLKELRETTGLRIQLVGKDDEYSEANDKSNLKGKDHIIYRDADSGELVIATVAKDTTNIIEEGQKVAFVADKKPEPNQ